LFCSGRRHLQLGRDRINKVLLAIINVVRFIHPNAALIIERVIQLLPILNPEENDDDNNEPRPDEEPRRLRPIPQQARRRRRPPLRPQQNRSQQARNQQEPQIRVMHLRRNRNIVFN
jgi:hypothetical protein